MLEEYSLNLLGARQADALEQHLLLCEKCRKALEETEHYIRLMKAATRENPRQTVTLPPKRLRVWGATGALAAGLAAVFMVVPRPAGSQPVALELISFRGGTGIAHAPARRTLEISFKAPDLPPASEYRVEVVTAAGEHAWTGAAQSSTGRLHATVPATLRKGAYW